jgi:hypothetical protein
LALERWRTEVRRYDVNFKGNVKINGAHLKAAATKSKSKA